MADSIKIVFEAVDKAALQTLKEVAKGVDGVTEAEKKNNKETSLGADVYKELFGSMSLATIASSALMKAFDFIVTTFKQQIQLAEEAQLVYARVEATLQSTGRTADFTAEQLAAMAQSFSLGTMFDDEGILEAINTLLRFDSVSSDSLPKITQLAIDMAAAMGTDVASAANLLGGALETGLLPKQLKVDAATRAQFKSFVELGDEASALGLMIEVLGAKFEGQATKMGDTSAGAAARVKIAYDNMKEAQGDAYLQMNENFNNWLADYLTGEAEAISIRNRAIEILKEHGNENVFYSQTLYKIVGASKEEVSAALEAARAEREHGDAIAGVRKEGEDGVNIEINFASYGFPEVEAQLDEVFSYERQINFMLQFQSNADNTKKELDDLYESQKETVAQIKEVEAKIKSGEITPEDGAEQLEGYRAKIIETTTAINDAVAAQEAFKKNMMFQMLFERMKSSGGELDEKEMGVLLEVAKEFGILDPASIEAISTMLEAVTGVDPNNLQDALDNVKALVDMDGRTVTIYVNEQTTTTDGGGTGTDTGGGGGGGGTCFTAETLISMADGTFCEFAEIKVGDSVLCWTGYEAEPTTVERVFFHEAEERVILKVTAGEVMEVTPEHTVLAGGEWITARDLRVGMFLTCADGIAEITKIVSEVRNVPVYNLHVNHEAHNYFASGFVVHNSDTKGATTTGDGGIPVVNLTFTMPGTYDDVLAFLRG